MTPDVLDRLRPHDPAAGLDPTPPDALLARLLGEPRPAPGAATTPPRRAPLARRGVRVAIGGAAAAALIAGASVAQHGGGSPSLAARAYAQTDPGGGVLHVILHDRTDFAAAQPHDTSGTVESWVHGDEAHTILTSFQDGRTFTSDQLLGADGVIRNLLEDGELQTLRPGDGAEAQEIIAQSRRDFVDDFRSRYEHGVLDDTGDTTFMGRPARRYVVTPPATRVPGGTGPVDPSTEEFFVDASSGAPLGSIFTTSMYAAEGVKDGKPVAGRRSTVRFIQVVDTIERLPATPANLEKVRTR
ncbi:MAG: hypothetical protein QOD69_1173 [Solirubrobacteraceae bacterium]|nr:hypothetical protein [Solirubrobacteraceae bacterium]